MPQECSEAWFIEGMENPMANRLPQAGKVVKERLGLRAELILIGLAEMPPVERREVCVWMERGENQPAVGMQHPMPFLQRDERRRHIGE